VVVMFVSVHAAALAQEKPKAPAGPLESGAEVIGRGEDAKFIDGFKLFFENDLISWSKLTGGTSTDRWYTNGVKLLTMLKEDKQPSWFPGLWPQVTRLWGQNYNSQFGYVFGHLTFTPADISNPEPQANDRFWGGYLYLGAVAQFRRKDRLDVLDTVEFNYGFVGPAALAEQVQKTIHYLTDSTQPQGWSNQLKNEPAANLTYMRHKRALSLNDGPGTLGLDVQAHGGGAVGTVYSYLNGGATLRFGRNIAGVPLGTIDVPSLGGVGQWQRGRWYLFQRVDLRLVLHNIFLDGSLFRSDPHITNVEKKRYVLFGNTGVSYEVNEKSRLSVSFNRRSSEFNSVEGERKRHNFTTFVWERRL
jgi:lipid A 3-O-deacylase